MAEKLSQTILTDVAAYGAAPRGHVSNVGETGGYLGIGPNIPNADASTPAVFNPVQVIITQLPTMFDKRPKIKRALKTILETCASSITGIDFEITLETADSSPGHDGQTYKVPTKTSVSAVSPTWNIMELDGNLIYNLIRFWITNIQHPDTNAGYSDIIKDFDEIPPHVFSTFSMSMCVIQYDPTGLTDRIIAAAYYSCMFPTTTSQIGFERTMGTTKVIERSIPFTGVVKSNDKVLDLAYTLSEYTNATGANYNKAPIGVTNVEDSLRDMGIEKEVEELNNTTA